MPPTGGPDGATDPLRGSNFPALNQKTVTGRFMILKRTDEGETLEKVSPVIIEKTISYWCASEVESIRRNRDGTCLIKTKNDKQADALLKLKKIASDVNVKVIEHGSLNKSKVVFSYYDTYVMDDEEMLLSLQEKNKDLKISKVERIITKRGGMIKNTRSFILTLNELNVPPYIKIGFLRIATRPYYPRPTRCFKCLQYGHISKTCNEDKRCFNCSEVFHGDDCDRDTKCLNCIDQEEKQHRPGSFKCPVWQKENKIIRLRVDQNLSFREAKQKVEKSESTSYADAAKKNLEQKFEDELKKREERFKKALNERDEKDKERQDQYKQLINEMKARMENITKEMNQIKTKYQAEIHRNNELVNHIKTQDHTIQKLQNKLNVIAANPTDKKTRKTKQYENVMASPPRKKGINLEKGEYNNQDDTDDNSDMDAQQIFDDDNLNTRGSSSRNRVSSK